MKLPEAFSKWSFIPGAVLLVIFLLFSLLGLFSPQVEMEGSVTVNAPSQVAWDRFTDTTRYGEWIPGFMAWSRPQSNPLKEGATWTYLTYNEGQTSEMGVAVTMLKPGEQYAYTLKNQYLTTEVDLRWEKEGGKSKVVGKQKVTGTNFLWRSALVVYRGMLDRQFQEQLVRMKSTMERS